MIAEEAIVTPSETITIVNVPSAGYLTSRDAVATVVKRTKTTVTVSRGSGTKDITFSTVTGRPVGTKRGSAGWYAGWMLKSVNESSATIDEVPAEFADGAVIEDSTIDVVDEAELDELSDKELNKRASKQQADRARVTPKPRRSRGGPPAYEDPAAAERRALLKKQRDYDKRMRRA